VKDACSSAAGPAWRGGTLDRRCQASPTSTCAPPWPTRAAFLVWRFLGTLACTGLVTQSAKKPPEEQLGRRTRTELCHGPGAGRQRAVSGAACVGLRLQAGQHAVPDALLAPAIEAAADREPGPVFARQISPRHTRPQSKMIASTTARWSSAGRPRAGFWGGRSGSKRAHCASVNSRRFRATPERTGSHQPASGILQTHPSITVPS
jgi:hypothetical protein